MKICKKNDCENPVFGGGYCRYHQQFRTDKKKKPTGNYSRLRTERNRVYSTLRMVYLQSHQKCEIQSPVCWKSATCIHHVSGRVGAKLMDMKTWKASCIPCNEYIESHDAWARENGFKESKFRKE